MVNQDEFDIFFYICRRIKSQIKIQKEYHKKTYGEHFINRQQHEIALRHDAQYFHGSTPNFFRDSSL